MDNKLDGIEPKDFLNYIDIEKFKEISTISDNHGLPLANKFVCLLNAPKKDTFKQNGWLEFQVAAVEVPNISLDQTELELNGARRFFSKGRSDSDLAITFYETPDLLLRRFFFSWMQEAVTVSEDVGIRRNYMSTYLASEFLVFPLNFNGAAYYCDRFRKVFPYDISGISYNYSRAGEVIQTTVRFKYMYHSLTEIHNSDNYHISTYGDKDSRKHWNK